MITQLATAGQMKLWALDHYDGTGIWHETGGEGRVFGQANHATPTRIPDSESYRQARGNPEFSKHFSQSFASPRGSRPRNDPDIR
jgi:hypothetical protein